jgi:DNA polymerase I-like protein with 3'-5' exonuclease and polymerase domains
MMTTDGQQTNAIYGFAKMLTGIIDDKKPAGVAVVFDLPQPTFRHVAYAEYKAHRPPSPEEFRSQVPLIKEMVKTFGLPVFELAGYEADDVIGTIAQGAVHQGYNVVIVTGDKDAFQLITDHIHVLTPHKGMSEAKEYDVHAFEERYEGLTPTQMIDLKALMGDPSDNIPGVEGIGEKTALALLKEYKSIDNLYAQLETIPRAAVKEKLRVGKELASLSRMLATIKTDVPVPFSVETCRIDTIPWADVVAFFKRMQLYSLVKKHEAEAQEQAGLFSVESMEQKPVDREKIVQVRLMKYLLNPERQIKDEDITQNDIDTLPEYERQLKELGLFHIYDDIELPLSSILDDMSAQGIKIDLAFLAKMSKELEGFIQGLEHAIYALAGTTFNLNSPKQLGEIFFEKLKMPMVKKTKTGYSTDASVLEELSYEFDIAKKILEYRQLTKLKSTYVDALPLLVNTKTGKIHATFNQTSTSTGRLSSSDPNMQNIPIRSEIGKKIRQAFVPEREDHVILTADYSQIELRILAHITQEPGLINAFAAGQDIHRATAAVVFGVAPEAVTDQQRSTAKAVNFGIAYGMAARKLAQTTGMEYKAAAKFIEDYFQHYPGIKKYIDDTIALVHAQGYVTTLLGRRRSFPEIKFGNHQVIAAAERAAINMPIQGFSADLIKMAMIRIDRELKHTKMKAKMIIQVHDELVFDVPEHEAYDLECLVKKEMAAVYSLTVPLVVNVATGKNWLEAK